MENRLRLCLLLCQLPPALLCVLGFAPRPRATSRLLLALSALVCVDRGFLAFAVAVVQAESRPHAILAAGLFAVRSWLVVLLPLPLLRPQASRRGASVVVAVVCLLALLSSGGILIVDSLGPRYQAYVGPVLRLAMDGVGAALLPAVLQLGLAAALVCRAVGTVHGPAEAAIELREKGESSGDKRKKEEEAREARRQQQMAWAVGVILVVFGVLGVAAGVFIVLREMEMRLWGPVWLVEEVFMGLWLCRDYVIFIASLICLSELRETLRRIFCCR